MVRNHFTKDQTKIVLHGGDIKYLPAQAFVKAIKECYLPRGFDIPCRYPEEVVVYSQFGIGVVSRALIGGLDE